MTSKGSLRLDESRHVWRCDPRGSQTPRVSVNAAPPESRAFANVANSPGLRRLRFPFFEPHCQRAVAAPNGVQAATSDGSKCFAQSQTQVRPDPQKSGGGPAFLLESDAQARKAAGKATRPRNNAYLRTPAPLVKRWNRRGVRLRFGRPPPAIAPASHCCPIAPSSSASTIGKRFPDNIVNRTRARELLSESSL